MQQNSQVLTSPMRCQGSHDLLIKFYSNSDKPGKYIKLDKFIKHFEKKTQIVTHLRERTKQVATLMKVAACIAAEYNFHNCLP